MRGKPATIGLAVVVSRIELSRKEGEEERSGEKEKERGQGVYLVVGFKRAKLSFSSGVPTREDLSSWGHSRLSLSLSVFIAASAHRVFAAFQSGKFSNAITLPPCVCLDKGIMRFYASCACFHGFLAVVYAPARREKIFEEARFSIHQRERCAGLVLASSPLSLSFSLLFTEDRVWGGFSIFLSGMMMWTDTLLTEKTSRCVVFSWDTRSIPPTDRDKNRDSRRFSVTKMIFWCFLLIYELFLNETYIYIYI